MTDRREDTRLTVMAFRRVLALAVTITCATACSATPSASATPGCHVIGAEGCEDSAKLSAAPSSVQSATRDWANFGGLDHLSAITNDFEMMGKSKGDQQMRTWCVNIQRDVEASQAYEPIPDPEAQGYWSAALAAYARAATDCIAGVDAHNSKLVGRSGDEIEEGRAHFNKLLARLETLAPN